MKCELLEAMDIRLATIKSEMQQPNLPPLEAQPTSYLVSTQQQGQLAQSQQVATQPPSNNNNRGKRSQVPVYKTKFKSRFVRRHPPTPRTTSGCKMQPSRRREHNQATTRLGHSYAKRQQTKTTETSRVFGEWTL